MQGTVKLQNAHAVGGECVFHVIHRSELRSVVLKDDKVSWIFTSSEIIFEAVFHNGTDAAPQIAALFFVELTSETGDVMWENSDENEKWFRDGEEVKV